MSWTNEFKVGIFVIVTTLAIVFGVIWTTDGVARGEDTYQLHFSAPTADGLWLGSPVKIAGVEIGSASEPVVVGDHSEMVLNIRAEYELPVNSRAVIRSSGLLGDRYIGIELGDGKALLKDGDRLFLKEAPADFEQITNQVSDITKDVQAITEVLRRMIETKENQEAVEGTLGNVEQLSDELRLMASQNRGDIKAIVGTIKRLAESLEGLSKDARADVDEELEKVKGATDTLQTTLDNLESMTTTINEGRGTIGALVNDDTTVELLNETIDGASSVISSFSGMKAKIYYTGRWHMGTQPRAGSGLLFGNNLAGTGSNTMGINMMSQEDFWYNFEVVDYPTGVIDYEEHYFPDSGEIYREYVRKPNFRISFMMNKRWWNFSARLGIKENGGGVGLSYWAFKDKLEFQADIFDFELGAYPTAPQAEGTPNLRVLARVNPMNRLYVELGAEQILLGAKYGYFTGFVGVGFSFNDDDIKMLMATLPLGL